MVVQCTGSIAPGPGRISDFRHRLIGEKAIRGLVDTDRVWGLGKAARVIADECDVTGLNYHIGNKTMFHLKRELGGMHMSQRINLRLEGGESAIPWDEVLRAGTGDG